MSIRELKVIRLEARQGLLSDTIDLFYSNQNLVVEAAMKKNV